jgi:hypothetical protein
VLPEVLLGELSSERQNFEVNRGREMHERKRELTQRGLCLTLLRLRAEVILRKRLTSCTENGCGAEQEFRAQDAVTEREIKAPPKSETKIGLPDPDVNVDPVVVCLHTGREVQELPQGTHSTV